MCENFAQLRIYLPYITFKLSVRRWVCKSPLYEYMYRERPLWQRLGLSALVNLVDLTAPGRSVPRIHAVGQPSLASSDFLQFFV